MPKLKDNNIVQKRNVMIGIRPNTMTFQEFRFFSIYLSKINKDKPHETRVVRFPLAEFRAIMKLGRINIDYMKKVTDSLLCKIVNVPLEDGKGNNKGFNSFQLFKECTVSYDDNKDWYVEIDAHDKALPLMFDYKNRFTSYRIWNILRLRSDNQQKMYEFLKQYEHTNNRTVIITIEELKAQLGIDKNEYGDRWDNFKKRVLDPCQQALSKYTDIKFIYEPYGKRGKGNKILEIIFFIEKNNDYSKQLSLDMFVDENDDNYDEVGGEEPADFEFSEDIVNISPVDVHSEESEENEWNKLFSATCGNEFSDMEMVVLYDFMRERLKLRKETNGKEMLDYLAHRYNYMIMRNEKKPIEKRFSYLLSLIGKDLGGEVEAKKTPEEAARAKKKKEYIRSLYV